MFDKDKREKLVESINSEYEKNRITNEIRAWFVYTIHQMKEEDIQATESVQELLKRIVKDIKKYDEKKATHNNMVVSEEAYKKYIQMRAVNESFEQIIKLGVK